MADDTEAKEVLHVQLPVTEIEEPDKGYVPEGFDTVEAYLADMRENYQLDLEADEDNRIAALEDKKFVAGEQWDPNVLEQRQNLPNLVVNTIPQFTAQLVGDWRENRISVKVLPAENGDKATADVRSDLIRAIETQERGSRAYDSAFESMVQCGDGAFKVAVQYASEDVFDQNITLAPIDDCLAVIWDRLSVDSTGRDATRCWVDDLLPKKEFDKLWPDTDPSTLSKREQNKLSTEGWYTKEAVRVTEHWRMIERERLIVMFQNGTTHALDYDPKKAAAEMEQLEKVHGPMVKSRMAPCRYAQMHLVTGFKILAGPFEWKLSRLPIIRMSGRVTAVGDRRVRFGLVRYMKDDVRLKNFWLSTIAEQLGYAPKAQWIATEAAVEGHEEDIRKGHLKRDPLLVVNDEAIIGTNIQRLDPPQMQVALLNQLQIHTQNMKDITGIHDASLGIKSNETSGRAIMARQREGDVASLTYYDNGNAAVMEAGDVMNQLIGQIYDGTRIVRIIGEDESAKLVKINDPSSPDSPNLAVGKYDVAITTGASYTTRRVEAAEAMMEAVQVFPQLMEFAGDLVAKAQDWPGAEELSERLRKTIPPQLLSDKEKQEMGDQGPNPQMLLQQQAQMQELIQKGRQQLQKLEVENATLKAKHDIELRKLAIEEFKAETDRIAAYGQFAAKDKEFELQELERQADQAMREEELEQERELSAEQESTQPAEQAATGNVPS